MPWGSRYVSEFPFLGPLETFSKFKISVLGVGESVARPTVYGGSRRFDQGLRRFAGHRGHGRSHGLLTCRRHGKVTARRNIKKYEETMVLTNVNVNQC